MVSSGILGAHTRGKCNCPEAAFLQGLEECIMGGSDPVTPTTRTGHISRMKSGYSLAC